ncbi:MAG: hypothetical protein JOS17DRAFT_732451 [Linnemannia elongata]|nr:MAG: hypothetical protein JOS17DRAFT_732451 [Linnemannia elongata]
MMIVVILAFLYPFYRLYRYLFLLSFRYSFLSPFFLPLTYPCAISWHPVTLPSFLFLHLYYSHKHTAEISCCLGLLGLLGLDHHFTSPFLFDFSLRRSLVSVVLSSEREGHVRRQLR